MKTWIQMLFRHSWLDEVHAETGQAPTGSQAPWMGVEVCGARAAADSDGWL